MLSKVICFFVLIAVAHSAPQPQHEQPARYPAGVNPALCPGFPICDNSLLHGTPPVVGPSHPSAYHAHPAPVPSWNHGAQSWNHVAHVPAPWSAPVVNHWDAPELHDPSNDLSGPGGDKYPAGVNPAACPNYPYCDTTLGASHHAAVAAPLPGYTQRQYPAHFNPASCPNFPYCHNNPGGPVHH